MSDFADAVDRQSTKLDTAETFGESDLSLSHSGTRVSAGSVEIGASGPSRPADGTSTSQTWGAGIIINPNESIDTLQIEISGNTGTVSEVVVTDTSENIIGSATGAISAGDTVEISATLSSGTDYYVSAYDGGDSFTNGYYNSVTTVTGGALDIVGGVRNSHPSDGSAPNTSGGAMYNIISVSVPESSGTATVEWPHPTDIYAWDTATYQFAEDGESVDVYIEENQAGGWTEIAGPISRGDSIDADPANNVRYRVELSRAETGNNPTLDAIYRRIKL